MSLLERAIAIALASHVGQIDKTGEPHIHHVLRVLVRLRSETDQIVGVLHDVLEDCPEWTVERLSADGFGADVLDALVALTRRPDETYAAFIDRCGRDEIARRVKLADLADNLDPSQPTITALKVRYRRAVAALTASAPAPYDATSGTL